MISILTLMKILTFPLSILFITGRTQLCGLTQENFIKVKKISFDSQPSSSEFHPAFPPKLLCSVQIQKILCKKWDFMHGDNVLKRKHLLFGGQEIVPPTRVGCNLVKIDTAQRTLAYYRKLSKI